MQCSKSDPSLPLCFPNSFNVKQDLKKDSPGPSKKNADCSSHMAISIMVPNPSENVNRETTYFITPPHLLLNHEAQTHPLITSKTLRLAAWTVSGKGYSERASKLFSSSRRQGSLSNYSSSWSS